MTVEPFVSNERQTDRQTDRGLSELLSLFTLTKRKHLEHSRSNAHYQKLVFSF